MRDLATRKVRVQCFGIAPQEELTFGSIYLSVLVDVACDSDCGAGYCHAGNAAGGVGWLEGGGDDSVSPRTARV